MAHFLFDPRYAEAFLHVEAGSREQGAWSAHRVLGKRLRPFSLWHKFQLEFANSPFLLNKDATVADLEFAVAVCRTQFPVRASLPKRGWLRRILYAFWAERVNLAEHVVAFSLYVEDYYSPPKLWKKAGQRKTPDVDETLSEVSLYRAHTGCTRDEPWNIPIGELYWMNLEFMRRFHEADFDVWTPMDEARFRAHVKRREARLKSAAEELAAKEGIPFEEADKRVRAEYWTKVRRTIAAGGKSVDAGISGKKAKPVAPQRKRK